MILKFVEGLVPLMILLGESYVKIHVISHFGLGIYTFFDVELRVMKRGEEEFSSGYISVAVFPACPLLSFSPSLERTSLWNPYQGVDPMASLCC